MKVAELLRALADMLGSIEDHETTAPAPAPVIVNVNSGSVPAQETGTTMKPIDKEAQDPAIMASPLQQELELLKRVAGIPSAFDNQ